MTDFWYYTTTQGFSCFMKAGIYVECLLFLYKLPRFQPDVSIHGRKENDKPLTDQICILEKYPGKGGWTYARVPGIGPSKNQPFGWVRVKGSIDDYPVSDFRLMPMGNGQLFFPVRADIRKKLKRKLGIPFGSSCILLTCRRKYKRNYIFVFRRTGEPCDFMKHCQKSKKQP